MTTATHSDPGLDRFLARLRAGLRGMPEGEIEEILREIRSHVTEMAGAAGSDFEAAIRSLGDPVDLATTYRTENLVILAECCGSPLVILQALRHASRTRAGRFTASALYIFGYANVITIWRAAVAKIFDPAATGLYYTSGDAWPLSLVTGGHAPPGGRELLGWWLVPLAVVAGWMVKSAVDHLAQGWLRRYRRSPRRASS